MGFVGLALGFVVLYLAWGVVAGRTGRLGRSVRGGLNMIGVAAGIFAVAGYWYARNYQNTGNPLFPMELKLMGQTLFEGMPYTDVVMISDDRPGAATKRLKNAWLQGRAAWPKSSKAYDSQEGGLGFLWVYGCLPAICIYGVYLLARLIRRRRLAELGEPAQAGFWPLLVISVVMMRLLPGNFIARYMIYLHGLGLPCLAAVAGGAIRSLDRRGVAGWLGRWAVGLALLTGAVWMIYEGTIVYGFNRENYTTLMGYQKRSGIPKGDWTPYDIAVCSDGALRAFTLFEEIMKSNQPVAFGAFPTHLQGMYVPGILSHPFGERQIHYLDDSVLMDARQFQEFVRRTGVKYLVLDGGSVPQVPPHVVPLARNGQHSNAYTVVALK